MSMSGMLRPQAPVMAGMGDTGAQLNPGTMPAPPMMTGQQFNFGAPAAPRPVAPVQFPAPMTAQAHPILQTGHYQLPSMPGLSNQSVPLSSLLGRLRRGAFSAF